MPTLVIDGLTALADHIRAEQDKASSRGFIRTIENFPKVTKRSNRSPESGTHPIGGTTIKYVVFDELTPDTVFYVSSGRLQIARGTQVRTLVDSESSFDPSAAVLRNLPPAISPDFRRAYCASAEAITSKKQKRGSGKR